jgi:hypothetical protein
MIDNMLNLLTLPGIIDTDGKVKQSKEHILKVIKDKYEDKLKGVLEISKILKK